MEELQTPSPPPSPTRRASATRQRGPWRPDAPSGRGHVETADGRTLEQHFLPIRVGERETSRVWVYRDVTARLVLERRQERLLRLERAARQTAEQQNERLRELDELKHAFVATVSHELRTPLRRSRATSTCCSTPTATRSPTSSACSPRRPSAGPSASPASSTTCSCSPGSSRARCRVEREPVDVPDVVHEAIDDVRRGAENGVTITADVGARPEVRSDRVRVLQIVTNLLGNAVKFARGEVRCSARCDGGSWIVEVEDDGPGIPPEDLPHVFEPFFRGRGRAPAEAGGTGLGLPISAQLARLLGGSLELQSGPRGGTIARLVLGGGEDDRPAEDA